MSTICDVADGKAPWYYGVVVLQRKQIKLFGYDDIRNARKNEAVKDMTVEEAYKQVCDELKVIYDVK